MTAKHLVLLVCEQAGGIGCLKNYPGSPTVGTVTQLREAASRRGWEVMRGKHGRDVCPPCRIEEIRFQLHVPEAGSAESSDG